MNKRIVTRSEILCQLNRWRDGGLSNEQMQAWARAIIDDELVGYDDWDELAEEKKTLWQKIGDMALISSAFPLSLEDGFSPNAVQMAQETIHNSRSAAKEVVSILAAIDIIQVLPEDVPMLIEFLSTPPGQITDGYNRFNAAYEGINFEQRSKRLSADPFYDLYRKKP